MRQLLDTHTFLWFVMGNPRITAKLRAQIEDNENLVSTVSIWEIAIKYGIGKLNLEIPFDDFIDRQIIPNGLQILDIKLEHLKLVSALPLHHRDPFDRLLIAQAITEDILLISADRVFSLYPVRSMWE
ncbi:MULTISPECIES: type II toxin-antitoxin system VapC family toxin [unclassified Chamaesiphon]|uniref:type II toxin-antitoxin system VapC family toxin n=1 Tax=unclassified Chamaesiphon TaxID=2620921 RepID=UPI00286BE8DB|nr:MULTISPECIES: type II toxin-antitoxin system VapC family toxin [unclassified Chamaesiphon]